MMSLFSFFFVFVAVCVSSSLAGDLPESFPRCHIDDADLNGCLLKATETVREQLKAGVKQIGFPALSPLVIPSVTVEQGTRNTKFKAIMTNATINGVENYKFKEFSFDPKTLTWKGEVSFESLSVVSDCDIDGKLFKAELHGKGKITASTGPAAGTFEITGELVKRDDKEYYHVVDAKMHLKVVPGGKAHVDSFGDNEDFVSLANQLIEDNAEDLISELREPMEKLAIDTLKEMLERIAKKIPFNKIFPKSS